MARLTKMASPNQMKNHQTRVKSKHHASSLRRGWKKTYNTARKILGFGLALLCAFFTVSNSSHADPLAPSLLEIIETERNIFSIKFQTPRKLPTSNPLPLEPKLPTNCTIIAGSEQRDRSSPAHSTSRWKANCPESLDDQTVSIKNLSSRSANTLLRVQFLDKRIYTTFLTPEQPSISIPSKQSKPEIFGQYLIFGVEHLAIGLDHILFLITLVMLNGFNRGLLITVTLFTVAHSITLGMTVLSLISFPVAVAEILIALSISYTCASYIRKHSSQTPMTTTRHTHNARYRVWAIAFGFGLLHGLGFASVLMELGLPQGEIFTALLAFNLGIEIGQLILVAMLLVCVVLLPRFFPSARESNSIASKLFPQPALSILALLIGTLAAIWFWQRIGSAIYL